MCTGQKRAPDLITDGCEPPSDCWELNSEYLEEQPVLLNAEPSLQPLNVYSFWILICVSCCHDLMQLSSGFLWFLPVGSFHYFFISLLQFLTDVATVATFLGLFLQLQLHCPSHGALRSQPVKQTANGGSCSSTGPVQFPLLTVLCLSFQAFFTVLCVSVREGVACVYSSCMTVL